MRPPSSVFRLVYPTNRVRFNCTTNWGKRPRPLVVTSSLSPTGRARDPGQMLREFVAAGCDSRLNLPAALRRKFHVKLIER